MEGSSRPIRSVDFQWRGHVTNEEINALHAEAFGQRSVDANWDDQLERLSLGWVVAHDDDGLVGFVNVIWDGRVHAFIVDTAVALRGRRQGIGTQLIAVAKEHAQAAGCEWLHVDFEDRLSAFYFQACGFTPTDAGLIQLGESIND